jgi:oligopeptide/dipeptide ABC transporter ATP-binding protein
MSENGNGGTYSILEVRGLSKHFALRRKGTFRKRVDIIGAVDKVDFNLEAGKTLALVGESGCGKTTAVRCVLRALRPTAGSVLFRPEGANGPVHELATLAESELKPLRRAMQMIFQDPFSSLNPRMSVEEIVGEPLLIHGLRDARERRNQVVELLEKVGLSSDQLRRYPHEFSGGQRQRIGIARALILRPRLVVADEAVSALDVSVRAQVLNLLMNLQEEFRLSYIFVSHDLAVVRHIADAVAVMYAGRIVEMAPTDDLFRDPRHPYTRALLAAVPHPDPDVPMNAVVRGEVADPANLPKGCAFHPRCPNRFDPCDSQVPPFEEIEKDRHCACHLFPNV